MVDQAGAKEGVDGEEEGVGCAFQGKTGAAGEGSEELFAVNFDARLTGAVDLRGVRTYLKHDEDERREYS